MGLREHATSAGKQDTDLTKHRWNGWRRAYHPMTTQYYTAASLDGFIATTDDSVAWLDSLGDVSDTGDAVFIQDAGGDCDGVGHVGVGAVANSPVAHASSCVR